MKRKYVPPMLEVYEYEVEHGYAQSQSLDPTDIVFDVSDSLEDVKEGKGYSLYGEDAWY